MRPIEPRWRRHGSPSTSSVGRSSGSTSDNLLGIGWSVTLSIIVLRTRVLPRWLGVLGLIVSALYLFNQGDILATALPGFPVFDLAGLIGSSGWGLGSPPSASRSSFAPRRRPSDAHVQSSANARRSASLT
jgi:hypothetical protein